MNKLVASIILSVIILGGCAEGSDKSYTPLEIMDMSDNKKEYYLQDENGEGYVIDDPAIEEWGLVGLEIGDIVQAELNEYGEIIDAKKGASE